MRQLIAKTVHRAENSRVGPQRLELRTVFDLLDFNLPAGVGFKDKEGRQRGRLRNSRTNRHGKLLKPGANAIQVARLMPQPLRRISPQLHLFPAGFHQQLLGRDVVRHHSRVISQDQMPKSSQSRNRRGLASTGMPGNEYRAPSAYHATGMQKQDPPLMEERAERRAEEKCPDVGRTGAFVRVDHDFVSGVSKIPRHAGDPEQILIAGSLEQHAFGLGSVQMLWNAAGANTNVRSACAGPQLANSKIRCHGEAVDGIQEGGWRITQQRVGGLRLNHRHIHRQFGEAAIAAPPS